MDSSRNAAKPSEAGDDLNALAEAATRIDLVVEQADRDDLWEFYRARKAALTA